MEVSITYILNTILGTVPLAVVVVAWIIRIEHRITRIETILDIAHEDTNN